MLKEEEEREITIQLESIVIMSKQTDRQVQKMFAISLSKKQAMINSLEDVLQRVRYFL